MYVLVTLFLVRPGQMCEQLECSVSTLLLSILNSRGAILRRSTKKIAKNSGIDADKQWFARTSQRGIVFEKQGK